MANDNQLKLGMSFEQTAPEGRLSNCNLNIDYPMINREEANAAQLDLVFGSIVRILQWSVSQARKNGESLEPYQAVVDSAFSQLQAVMNEAGRSGSPGVIR